MSTPRPTGHWPFRWKFSIQGGRWLFLAFLCLWGTPRVLHAEGIAILTSADITAYAEAVAGFTAHLPPSAHITFRQTVRDGKPHGHQLARRLRTSGTTMVLAVGLKATLVAKQVIRNIPVVYCLVLNPQQYGLPAGNMVEISPILPFQDQVTLFPALLPHASRLGVLFDPQKTAGMVSRIEQEARTLGFTLLTETVHNEQDIPRALNSLPRDIHALWLLPDSTVITESSLDFLVSWTLERHIPVIGFSPELVKSGALMATFFPYVESGQEAARVAAALLTDRHAPLLGSIVRPRTAHRALNQKTASYLDIPLAAPLLRQFDEHF